MIIENIVKILHDFIQGNHLPRDTGYTESLHQTAKDILAAQWIDGPPKDTLEGKFVLVFKDGEVRKCSVWDTLHGPVKSLRQIYPPIIKHMELPDYE